jgi:hypothetical protein
MKSLLLKEDNQLWPNQNLNDNTSQLLQKLCRWLVNDTIYQNIVFTTGLWLSDIGTPMRLPVILAPVLRVMQRLIWLWITWVEYRIYQATDFIIDENSLNREKALKNASIMEKYIHHYLATLYPKLMWKVWVYFWIKLTPEDIHEVSNNLIWFSDRMSIWDINSYASSKSKSLESAYRYGAANIICNGHILEKYPLQSWDIHEVIIPVWGRKEKPFFELWKQYENLSWENKRNQVIPLIHRVWERPPYYPQQGEDYIDHNWVYIPIQEWTQLHPVVGFDRRIILDEFWTQENLSQLTQDILC